MLDLSKFSSHKELRGAGLGEVLFDVFGDDSKLGGAPANFAFHCSQLGLSCSVISAVGKDNLGKRAKQELQSCGLDTAFISELDYPTGKVDVTVDKEGIAHYDFLDNTAYDNIPDTKALTELAQRTNVVCFGSLAQRSQTSRNTIHNFLVNMPEDLRLRVFDVNLRCSFYSRQIIESTLKLSEVFKCNEDELPVLAKLLNVSEEPDAFYRDLREKYGICGFIFTKGGEGSAVYLNDEKSELVSKKVHVVDTVGAGDSFTASLITALVKGLSLKQAHELAVNVSAFICTCKGAMAKLPQNLLLKI